MATATVGNADSDMAARGERPEVIQRVMRHSEVSSTIDRYVKGLR